MIDWKILDIEPAEDLKVIKRAYAKQLKHYHPEDDPKGYQHLRETYEKAVSYVRKKENDNTAFTKLPTETVTTIHYHHSQTPLEEFIEKLQFIYHDFNQRIDISSWKNLLDFEAVWSVEWFPRTRHAITEFLDQHSFLPIEVWLLLNETFDWEKWDQDFYKKYLEQHNYLRYDCLKSVKDSEADRYLEGRNNVYEALKANNLKQAEKLIDNVKLIFADDPELLRLQGIYYQRKGNARLALQCYCECLEKIPNDVDCRAEKIRLLHQLGRWKEVIEETELLRELNDIPSIKFLYIKALMETDQWNKAEEEIHKMIDENPNDVEANNLFTKIIHHQRKNKKSRYEKTLMNNSVQPFSFKDKLVFSLYLQPYKKIFLLFFCCLIVQSIISDSIERSIGYTFFEWFPVALSLPSPSIETYGYMVILVVLYFMIIKMIVRVFRIFFYQEVQS
ncbi:J domain-containing protein [Gracilibacillus massiliensis]|uniref:J domain-containing protein n=1 Tax=Gracilibacillus massiliensis TaxID=1564956 RepID=UPI00071CD187|nr:J domain-containing protein [Gracilibacillus massiliensis]